MDDVLIFLIGINENGRGRSVSHVTNKNEWQHILATARANGWKPLGTILDYEFQYELIASQFEELDFDKHTLLDQFVTDKCGRWRGGYLIRGKCCQRDHHQSCKERGLSLIHI